MSFDRRSIRRRARGSAASLLASMLAVLALPGDPAAAQESPPEFDIPSQDAAAALAEFSDQANLQLLFDFDAVQGVRTQAVTGRMRIADALGRLLTGTGLTFEIVNDRTISVLR